jgi:hypothetical protein
MPCYFSSNRPSAASSLRKPSLPMFVALTYMILLLTALTSPKSHVAAFPFGAGHCSAGTAIANAAHGTSGSGSLDNGNYELRIQEIPSADSSASSSCPRKKFKSKRTASLYTGTEYKVTLKTDDDDGYFRGFLFRLSGKGGDEDDIKQAMIVSPDSAAIGKDHTMCTDIDAVVGVTHTNASDKTSVDVILNFVQPVEATLEVTVVRNNNPMGGNLWYYSAYDIVVSDFSSPSSKSSKSSKSCRGIKMMKSSKKSKKSSKL